MARTTTVNVRLSDEQMSGLHARVAAVADKFKAVRELHKPVKVATSAGVSSNPLGVSFTATYAHTCRVCLLPDGWAWPCATARLVYTDDEITNPPTTP